MQSTENNSMIKHFTIKSSKRMEANIIQHLNNNFNCLLLAWITPLCKPISHKFAGKIGNQRG